MVQLEEKEQKYEKQKSTTPSKISLQVKFEKFFKLLAIRHTFGPQNSKIYGEKNKLNQTDGSAVMVFFWYSSGQFHKNGQKQRKIPVTLEPSVQLS